MKVKEFLDVCFEICQQIKLRGFVFDGIHSDGTCDNLKCYYFVGENYVYSDTLKAISDFELDFHVYRCDTFTDYPCPDYARFVIVVFHPSFLPF